MQLSSHHRARMPRAPPKRPLTRCLRAPRSHQPYRPPQRWRAVAGDGSSATLEGPSPADPTDAPSTSTSNGSSGSSSSSGVDATPAGGAAAASSPRAEAQLTLEQYKEIYDRLITVFQSRPREDWKKLIVFSAQWGAHHRGVFDRIKERAEAAPGVDAKLALRQLLRQLQGVHDEIGRYNRALARVLQARPDEWEAVVAQTRGDMQRPFFEHLAVLIAACRDDAERQEKLIAVNTRLLALVASHDSIAADQAALDAAAGTYRDLLASISSVEDADAKMADLAAQGKIDPAFLQITARAYGAARDTEMTLDEAKWVSYRLYLRARDYFDRQQPTEKRVLEYLASLHDPAERSRQLDAAVTPGPVRETDTHDYMYTTPQRLYLVVNETLKAFDAMQAGAERSMGATAATSTPRKVRALRELREEIVRRYL